MTTAITANIGGYIGAGVGFLIGGIPGSKLGFDIGAGVGVAAGIYVDTQLLQPALPDGPRRDPQSQQRVTTRDEGAAKIRAFGRTVRVPGSIVWEQWPPTEIEHENKSGKGPGAGGEFLTYTYTQSFAVEWCKCFGRPIKRVLKVWANGETVYNTAPDFGETSTLISAIKKTSSVFVGSSPPSTYYYHYAVYRSAPGGPDLTALQEGKDVIVSGFSDTAFNGTFLVVDKKLYQDGTTQIKALLTEGTSATHPAGPDEPAGNSVSISQSFPAFAPTTFASVDHYEGSLTQIKDPTISTWEGEENVHAMRDRAVSVFKDWRLENYGNLVPQTLEALIEVDEFETVGTALDELLDTAGIDSTQRDTSACTDALDGMFTTTRTAPVEPITQLMIAYDLMMRDDGGVLTFEPRSTVDIVPIETSKLVAHAPGENPPRDVQHEPRVRRELPSAVTVSYKDPAKDYEPGAETYVVQSADSSTSSELIELNLTLTSAQAQAIARRMAWSARAASHGFEGLQLPPSLLGTIKPGTVLQFDADGRTWDMLARSVLVGVNDVIRVGGEEEQRQTLTHATESSIPGAGT